MRGLRTAAFGLGIMLVVVSTAVAQVDRRPPGDDKVGASVALQVAGAPYQFSGKASCTHDAKAGMFGVIGEKWQVVHSEGARSVILNFMRPINGAGDMFSMSVESGGKSYQVDTLRAKPSDAVKGLGTVSLAPAGNGGTFTIDAKAENGAKISGTIKCEAFTTRAAVAGH